MVCWIYICRVGNFENCKSHNQLLICQGIKNGILFYNDEAKLQGIGFFRFQHPGSFFRLWNGVTSDMFLLNHFITTASFTASSNFGGNTWPGFQVRYTFSGNDLGISLMYLCRSLHQSIIYRLWFGIVVSDPTWWFTRIFTSGNDFHENDHLYINNGHGGFKDIHLRSHHAYQSVFNGRWCCWY